MVISTTTKDPDVTLHICGAKLYHIIFNIACSSGGLLTFRFTMHNIMTSRRLNYVVITPNQWKFSVSILYMFDWTYQDFDLLLQLLLAPSDRLQLHAQLGHPPPMLLCLLPGPLPFLGPCLQLAHVDPGLLQLLLKLFHLLRVGGGLHLKLGDLEFLLLILTLQRAADHKYNGR